MSDIRGAYVRPEIPDRVYRDDAGTPIAYGHRWGFGDPDEAAYSVCSHPERFEPVVTVARAQIDHLARAYDVEPRQDPDALARVRERAPKTTEAVTLAPAAPLTARLTFLFAEFPGVRVQAGEYCEERFPVCGCDACDDSVESLIEDLEGDVFGVVQGHFREYVDGLFFPRLCAEFTTHANRHSSARPVSWRESVAKRRTLRPVKRGWRPWPKRPIT